MWLGFKLSRGFIVFFLSRTDWFVFSYLMFFLLSLFFVVRRLFIVHWAFWLLIRDVRRKSWPAVPLDSNNTQARNKKKNFNYKLGF